MSDYGWVIIKDNISAILESDGSYVGVCGPRECPLEAEELKKHPAKEKFRLLDGDGDVHYYGYWVPINPDVADAEEMFGPLDDFGALNSGCTSIEYRENGIYKPL